MLLTCKSNVLLHHLELSPKPLCHVFIPEGSCTLCCVVQVIRGQGQAEQWPRSFIPRTLSRGFHGGSLFWNPAQFPRDCICLCPALGWLAGERTCQLGREAPTAFVVREVV